MSHASLNRFITEVEHWVPRAQSQQECVQGVIRSLQKVMSNPELLPQDLRRAIQDGHHDGRVYTSPENKFFVQFFVWPPHAKTPVHDHNTWGVMGILHNQLEITEYHLKPTEQNGRYDISEKDNYVAGPGSIAYVTYPDDEIHLVQNPSDDYSYSLHIYGDELDHTHVFDLESGEIRPAG